VTPHLTSVIAMEANHDLRLIGSVDKSRKCILSMLYTGKFVRSFVVDGNDSIQKLKVFSNGSIVILAELELPNGMKTKIRLYGIDARKIAEVVFEEKVLKWLKAEYDCAFDCLVVSFVSGRLLFLRVPDFAVLLEAKTEMSIVTLTFWRNENAFIATDSEGKIWLLRA
jgi:hypothetical protein